MNARTVCAAGACLAATLMAGAEVKDFALGDWSSVRVERSSRHLVVKDAAGRPRLHFTTEGGAFYDALVVSGAVDRLIIDARAAFRAGMRKLVFTSPDIGPQTYGGRDCTLVTTLSGAKGSDLLAYFEGHGAGGHYYRSRTIQTKGHRKDYPLVTDVAKDLNSLHLRWDLAKAAARGPLEFFGARYGTFEEFPVAVGPSARFEPQLIFHAPFDGNATAVKAGGAAAPCRAQGVEFVEGKRGGAVRLTAKAKSVLAYETAGNLVPERGTVSLWFKREWPDRGRTETNGEIWRMLFANPPPAGERVGSGQLALWWWGDRLRADQGDDDDGYAIWYGTLPADGWTHVAMSWDERGTRIYLNGSDGRAISDGASPMISALKPQDQLSFSREVFKTFFVGGQGSDRQFDGLIDDLRIYSAPLSDAQVRELYRRESVIELKAHGLYALENVTGELVVSATSPAGCSLKSLKYCLCDSAGKVVATYPNPVSDKPAVLKVNLPAGQYVLKATDGEWFYGAVSCLVMRKDNPYLLASAATDRPGRPRDLQLVASLKLDRLPPADRFRAVGPTRIGQLGDVPYLEAGPGPGDRFALRLPLDAKSKLWCFEIDYPDDARRTADLIVQKSKDPGGDYTLQVGYAAGDEYPNTGRILTHRCLYWASDPDVTLIAMTARAAAPAAIAAVRVYRVVGDALPAAAVQPPVRPAAGRRMGDLWRDLMARTRVDRSPETNGWDRCVGLYFEDPAIGYDFAVPKSNGFLPDDLETMIDRTAALMKYTGQNLFAYPGAWYHGLIGERYNPRHHAPDFLSAWYAKFDAEGLSIMPTVNPNTMPVPDGLVTRRSMGDGSLHDSVVAIHDTGKPNWGGWHDTPPNFNFHHPDVRRHISQMIDTLVEQGVRHPSFKGVCLHMTRHCLLWFGDEASGYNDYTVAAFAKAKGLKIPVDRTDPLRGKAYADWLRANAWEDWIQWRCDQVSDFYAREARKLAARRPDLKLWLNYLVPANVRHPDFTRPDFMEQANRACGLDRVRLTKEIPNLILCQTLVPADYRWRSEARYPTPAARAHQRIVDTLPGFYALLRGAASPWVHQHDRYWESPIGRSSAGAGTLSCAWLKECPWRVSTINPSGVNALRHFVVPLRYGDVLGLTKGGFLIGTYGMEEQLVPFVQAFRALPGVVFDDVGGTEVVKLRHKDHFGRSWFYVVNTDVRPATVTLDLPPKTQDLVSGETWGGLLGGASGVTLRLAPYQMRSFSAPAGRPKWVD
ncbi:MAG: LamG-like jellyroll fold domain-containing protein [Kiritimatiellia bacterium]